MIDDKEVTASQEEETVTAEDPPNEIRGSGTPTIGSNPITKPTLTNA